jgi:hypothetical protein
MFKQYSGEVRSSVSGTGTQRGGAVGAVSLVAMFPPPLCAVVTAEVLLRHGKSRPMFVALFLLDKFSDTTQQHRSLSSAAGLPTAAFLHSAALPVHLCGFSLPYRCSPPQLMPHTASLRKTQ